MPFISLFSSSSLGSLSRLKKFITSIIYSADPYFSNVIFLMHMDGVNNGTSFPDEVNHVFSKAGGSPVTTTAFSKFGGASLSTANGTGYIATPGATSMSSPTGDFTLEAWVYPTAFSGNGSIICGQTLPTLASNGIGLQVVGSGQLFGYFYTGTTLVSVTSTASVPLNAWSHVAYTRTAGSINVWINGVLGASLATSAAVNSVTTQFTTGAGGDGGQPFFGYIDELRYTLGVARYTANFTAPTAAFPGVSLTPVDPYFAKVSLLMHMDGTSGGKLFPDVIGRTITPIGTGITTSATSKFGGAAAQFGASSYLTTPASPVFELGASDFTIEGWIYCPSSAPVAAGHLCGTWRNGSLYGWVVYASKTATNLTMYFGYSTTGVYQSAKDGDATNSIASIPLDSWNHFAYTRTGGVLRGFLNGTLVISKTINADSFFTTNQPFTIGRNSDGQQFQGGLDELRITNGVARYTANFTVPTEAFPSQ